MDNYTGYSSTDEEEFVPFDLLAGCSIPPLDFECSLNSHLVRVTHIDTPSNFYVILEDKIQYFAMYSKNLNDFYNNEKFHPTANELPIGSYWCINYNGNWMRAQMELNCGKKLNVNKKVVPYYKMLLLDKGTIVSVSLDKVRSLDDQFTVDSPMAIPCLLSDVYPKNFNWSSDAIEIFANLCNDEVHAAIFWSKKLSGHYDVILENIPIHLENRDSPTINELLTFSDYATSVLATNFQKERAGSITDQEPTDDLTLSENYKTEATAIATPYDYQEVSDVVPANKSCPEATANECSESTVFESCLEATTSESCPEATANESYPEATANENCCTHFTGAVNRHKSIGVQKRLNTLDEWNPMLEDQQEAEALLNDNDPDSYFLGYKNEDERNICSYIRYQKPCLRGDNCKWLHTEPREDGLPSGTDDIFTRLKCPPIIPTEGSMHRASILTAKTPSMFYSLFENEGTSGFNVLLELQENLTEAYKSQQFKSAQTIPALGELMVLHNKENDSDMVGYYRVRIIGTSQRDLGVLVEVIYIDYGTQEWVKECQLRPILGCFLYTPAQALECYLFDVIPKNDKWDVDAIRCFNELVDDKFGSVTVLTVDPGSERFGIELEFLEEEVNVNSTLICRGYAQSV